LYRPKTTIEQWRILQAVVDFGGYAQAGQALNKSQSSLNHAVSKLQGMLGVQLLEVKGRKAVLTKAGEVMLRRSRDLTQNVESLEQLAININQDWEPEITLAVDMAYPRQSLHEVLEAFLPLSRGSRITVLDTVLTGSEEAVIENTADLVVLMNVPKGFLGEALCHVEFVLVCHPNHALVKQAQPLNLTTLAQHLQIVIKDTGTYPKESSGWLKSENRWTVSNFNAALSLLSKNLGFCWLPKHEVNELVATGKLAHLSVQGSAFKQSTAFLVCPNPDQIGPGTQLLSELILQYRQIDLPSFPQL
jgi:DNA-binding transcriptional LysR family regulator